MKFSEYQKEASKTAQYPKIVVFDESDCEDGVAKLGIQVNFLYAALGLMGEAGEVGEKIKKIVRNKFGEYDVNDTIAVKKELGDVMWYVSEVASCFGLDLDDIAQANLDKLADRVKRDVINSEGDDR